MTRKGAKFSKEHRDKISAALKGKSPSIETRLKMSAARKGKSPANKGQVGKQVAWNKGSSLSDETKLKISRSLTGKPGPNKGKKFSEQTRQKMRESRTGKKATAAARLSMRLAAIDRVSKYIHKWTPAYNPNACKLFDDLNKDMNWNGQHAENGGEYHIKELGYWLDYYEPTLNIVIEYDEPDHARKTETDLIRQQEIINYLNCKFYRINALNSEFDFNLIKEEYDPT